MSPRIFNSLIQSNMGGGPHGNFEAAIINHEGKLQHWWRDNANGETWKPGQLITGPADQEAGPASIIQSDLIQNGHGNFEVVAPLRIGNNTVLWHFWRNNAGVTTPWQKGQQITGPEDVVAGPASIIQSDFIQGGRGNFEVVVPLRVGNNTELWHFWRNNADVTTPWQKGQRVTGPEDIVAGPASIIQSDFIQGGHGNFEVVVPLHVGSNTELWHFWKNNADVTTAWQRGQRVTGPADQVAGPGSMIQSDFMEGGHGNFEVVVPLFSSNGRKEVWHFWRNNADVATPWQKGQLITASASGNACIIRSDYVSSGHPHNFEVLTDECSQSVVHYRHLNEDVTFPWLRDRVIIGEPALLQMRYVQKVAQLTGEYDRTVWKDGDPSFAFNRTETQLGLQGTDLGVSFRHNAKVFFLFGDSWGRHWNKAGRITFDAIAHTTDLCARDGLHLTFNKQAPVISGGDNITQAEFDVPLDGFSLDGRLYVFFSSNHFKVGNADVMGRSVLCVSIDEGLNFRYIGTYSGNKFINVSVVAEQEPARYNIHSGAGLWIWGSGRYRSSDVYLSFLPFANILNGSMAALYFAGTNPFGQPVWSGEEADAVALFSAGCIGEFSVRFSKYLQQWVITYNGDNPRGIILRTADTPYGPWPEQQMLFNPFTNGYSKIMHSANTPDKLNEPAFWGGGNRYGEAGGEYGPYQASDYETGIIGRFAKIYFTLSTWNPYQTNLMYGIVPVKGSTEADLENLHVDFTRFDTHCMGRGRQQLPGGD